jgi:hypothetical protein
MDRIPLALASGIAILLSTSISSRSVALLGVFQASSRIMAFIAGVPARVVFTARVGAVSVVCRLLYAALIGLTAFSFCARSRPPAVPTPSSSGK